MLSLPFGIRSPYGSGVLVSFLFCASDGCRCCCALSPYGWASNLSEASLRALALQVCFLVVLAEDESIRLSLALSSVLPCPMLWLHVRLHDTCSRSKGPWCLALDPSGTYFAFVPQFEAPSESLTHSIPRSFLVE